MKGFDLSDRREQWYILARIILVGDICFGLGETLSLKSFRITSDAESCSTHGHRVGVWVRAQCGVTGVCVGKSEPICNEGGHLGGYHGGRGLQSLVQSTVGQVTEIEEVGEVGEGSEAGEGKGPCGSSASLY